MAEGKSQDKSRFRRVAHIVKLILRVFTPHKSVNTSPRRHLNLEQLALYDGLHMIAEGIHQRLQRVQSQDQGVEGPASQHAYQLIGFSQQVKDILCCPPWNRTMMDIEVVRKDLQKSYAFQDYPSVFQTALCRVAWYQYLTDGRTFIRAGDRASAFYIILSGKVIITNHEAGENTLHGGDTFGDIEINSGSRRLSTCTVSGSTELLVISKSDYLDIGLRQARKSYQKAKPYEFCRSINLLKYWPLVDLEKQTDMCKIFYCRANHVVVKDSKKSDWIYIVMTGTCRVVKRFVDTPPRRTSMQVIPNGEGRKVPTKGGTLPESPLLTEQTLVQRPRDRLRHSYTTGNIQTMEASPRPPARKQFLVQLDILHPKDIFGLSTLVHDHEPSVTLMSNGAELVVLAKSFISTHMTESLQNKLRRQVVEYPSEESMRKRIRDHYTWNTLKQVQHAKRKL
ncbi:uncharacterized protein LOC135350362 isoform X3 [Halichondria panicea]|uniref:uncharacterized protein LOC135350362 isoform X3 n=1 Tax=Halichondria panicea TaxID=6063 RepID=UPI00312B6E33